MKRYISILALVVISQMIWSQGIIYHDSIKRQLNEQYGDLYEIQLNRSYAVFYKKDAIIVTDRTEKNDDGFSYIELARYVKKHIYSIRYRESSSVETSGFRGLVVIDETESKKSPYPYNVMIAMGDFLCILSDGTIIAVDVKNGGLPVFKKYIFKESGDEETEYIFAR